ncbi:MAG: hypothetical protein ACI97N_000323 [Cognaticolwellia sp.]|jgi:hypothetical protein
MKRFSIIFLIFVLASCEQNFLERSPIIGITQDNFYQTEEDAIAAVNAAYSTLQFEVSPGGHFRWFWGDIMSDDSDKGGSGDNDAYELLLLETFQGPVNTDLLEGEWSACYEGIYRANTVLEYIPAMEISDATKNQVIAEAKFIRAWLYYNLVTIFGDVPKVDRLLSASEYNMESSPKSEIWALITQDLTDAMAVLPAKSAYPSEDLGRITRGAVKALLVKSYLWQENWSAAQSMAEEIVNSNEYQLTPNYADIFTTGGENNMESIFEIQYMNASGGNWGKNNANEGTFSNVFQRARGAFEGYGFNIPTQDFVDEFSAEGFEDPRLSATVFREGDAMGDRGIFTKDATGMPFDFYAKKYFNNKGEEAPFGDPNPNGGTNDRVIRYADVLLMHAEAAAKNGNEAAAKSSLNAVRARASTSSQVLPDVTSSGQVLIDAIYRERRIELGMEGHRFFDLVRTGRGTSVLGSLGYTEGKHNVFPIPQSQIQATNGAIKQNPGY